MNKPTPREAWRVAALTMMTAEELHFALQGDDAAAWVEAAAECGLVEAQLRLGRMLLEGEGTLRHYENALACFKAAAKSGNADGHNMLGRCFENGWGTQKDFAAAAHHYRIAADAGLDWAQYNLGHMLLSGIGVLQDRALAFAFYGLAAAQGHVRAMNLMGRCYEQGWGVARDLDAARVWYRRSAEGGYFRGAYNYADLLASEGCLVGAKEWFARALSKAPEPSRNLMVTALLAHKEPILRALAKRNPEARLRVWRE
jgi:TPR repeat protein